MFRIECLIRFVPMLLCYALLLPLLIAYYETENVYFFEVSRCSQMRPLEVVINGTNNCQRKPRIRHYKRSDRYFASVFSEENCHIDTIRCFNRFTRKEVVPDNTESKEITRVELMEPSRDLFKLLLIVIALIAPMSIELNFFLVKKYFTQTRTSAQQEHEYEVMSGQILTSPEQMYKKIGPPEVPYIESWIVSDWRVWSSPIPGHEELLNV